MSRNRALPFLVLPESAVMGPDWTLLSTDKPLSPVSDRVENWDAGTDVRLRGCLEFDSATCAAALGLAGSVPKLRIVCEAGTGPGSLPRLVIGRVEIDAPADGQVVNLSLDLDGSMLSTGLTVTTTIILGDVPDSPSTLSPIDIGSRLWAHRLRLRLESDDQRLPVEVANLELLFPRSAAAQAPWFLSWAPREWTRDLQGALRLVLNERRGDIVERVSSGDAALLQVIMADVIGQVLAALALEEFSESIVEGAEPGSMGWQAGLWVETGWPRGGIPEMVRQFRESPGRFRSTVHAIAELPESAR